MDIPGYLTTDQAAARLGVNAQSVFNYAHRDPDFPEPVKVGRASLWPVDQLDAWRKEHPARRRSAPDS